MILQTAGKCTGVCSVYLYEHVCTPFPVSLCVYQELVKYNPRVKSSAVMLRRPRWSFFPHTTVRLEDFCDLRRCKVVLFSSHQQASSSSAGHQQGVLTSSPVLMLSTGGSVISHKLKSPRLSISLLTSDPSPKSFNYACNVPL